MKEYLRILSFSNKLGKFIPSFFILSLFAGLFGVLNLVLLKPLLDVLFGQISHTQLLSLSTISSSNPVDLFQKFLAQTILKNGKLAALSTVCVSIIGFSFLSNIFRYYSLVTLERFKISVISRIRKKAFDSVLGLHLGFFNKNKKGELISKITTDVQEIENSVNYTFSAAIKELILLISYLGALFYISWQLTLFSLIVIPITGAFLGIILKKMRHNAGETQQILGKLLSIMEESFGAMRVVKAFDINTYFGNRFENENQAYANALLKYSKKKELANPFSEFIGVSMVAGLLFFGGKMVLGGSSPLSPSTFIAFMAVFSQVVRPAKEIAQAIGSAQRGLVSARRVFELMDMPNEIAYTGTKNFSFLDKIEVKDLSFAYQKNIEVLKNINLIIPKGKTIALVGTSGGGKSTVSDLMMQFYLPNAGTISIDGEPIQNISIDSLRENVGLVSQDPVLFNDTIFNNIALGRACTKLEMESAAKMAFAYDFIMETSHGFETVIGDRGSKLSGGQRQRLSIARAILKNPTFLILDEATSALDNESEKYVQEALNGLLNDRTTLVIAHRLSTIESADYIYVLKDGMVVEEGTHQGLKNLKEGYYKTLLEVNFKPLNL